MTRRQLIRYTNMINRRRAWVLATIGALIVVLGPWHPQAKAQNFDYEISSHVSAGKQSPKFTFTAPMDLHEVRLSLRRDDGTIIGQKQGPITPGQTVTFQWKQGLGSQHYQGILGFDIEPGDDYQLPLEFDILVAKNLIVDVPSKSIDKHNWTLVAKANAPVQMASIQVIGVGGQSIFDQTLSPNTSKANEGITLPWGPLEQEALRIDIKMVGEGGVEGTYVIWPWSYEVPHEEIEFASGMADISEEQQGKLKNTLSDIQSVLNKYGDVVDIKLYIAGYTDTVDSSASNVTLSRNRAQSIAVFFRSEGFKNPVYYQGFGERALAVHTADGVNMAANRRAVYVLAAQPPSDTAAFPDAEWLSLK